MQKKGVSRGYCLVLLLAILALSCGHGRYGETIPSRKFINVLVDVHLADGMAVENMNALNKGPRLDSAALYKSVFDKYGVTRVMFDSTMSYYTEHPDEFQKVYNQVTAKLKRMEDDLNAAQDAEERAKTEVVDTIVKE